MLLLTTQQRDRITKLVLAAEILRQEEPEKYGHTPISIGFWVGEAVTPNDFDGLSNNKDSLQRQLLTCPFCGTSLKDKDNFYVDNDAELVTVNCPDEHCPFHNQPLPIHLVDTEIYQQCPTILLSTVYKFA